MDSWWRKETLKPVRAGMRVLDIGCGTGDLAIQAAQMTGEDGRVVGLDFSSQMLYLAERRRGQMRKEARHLRFVCGKAEDLPLNDEAPFDLAVSGFVLRNFYERIDGILGKIRSSLKEGGEIRFLDFTEPPNRFLRGAWKFYMNTAAELYGRILFGRSYPHFYLTNSAARFVKPEEFVEKLKAGGFGDVRLRRFLFGTIVLYQARRN